MSIEEIIRKGANQKLCSPAEHKVRVAKSLLNDLSLTLEEKGFLAWLLSFNHPCLLQRENMAHDLNISVSEMRSLIDGCMKKGYLSEEIFYQFTITYPETEEVKGMNDE
jgi:hypothetical protein